MIKTLLCYWILSPVKCPRKPSTPKFQFPLRLRRRKNRNFVPHPLQILGLSASPVVVVVVYGKLAFSSSYAVQKRPFFCSTSRPTQFNSSSCEAINGLMENGLVHTIYYQQYQGVMQSIQIMFNHNNFDSDLKSD